MRDVYQKLISITIKSEYFGDSSENFVTVLPTDEWDELFKKHHIKYKSTPNGLLVLATEAGRDRLTNLQGEMPFLTFEVASLMPGIKNMVDVQQHTNKATPYLRSITGTEGFDEKYLLPVRRSLGRFYAYVGATVRQPTPTSEEGVDILHDTTLRPGDRAFFRLLETYIDGRYRVRGRNFYLAKRGLRPGHCAILEIDLSEVLAADSALQKTLSVPTREVYLKYWINSTHHDLNSLSVKDDDGKISFESKGVGPYGMLFQSSTRLKLLQQSPYNLRLVNGKKKPLISKLPLGNAVDMKPMEQQPDEYFNEVFINV